ncbi:MAG: ABC transporter ATP-binding protein [Clostridiaceae bacterium]
MEETNNIPYIELLGAAFRYPKGDFVIENASLTLFQNEFTAITGPNGSGKTTLGKLIMGIIKPDRGCVKILDRDTREMTLGEIGKKVGYLFQNPERQLFSMSIREEISFPMEIKGIPKEEIKKKVNEMLEAFSLTHLEGIPTFKLSRGEKQRLAIASILVNNPGFFVMDEPTTGLDAERKKDLSELIRNLQDKGIGMAVISHDMHFIKQLADRTITLSGGKIIDDSR